MGQICRSALLCLFAALIAACQHERAATQQSQFPGFPEIRHDRSVDDVARFLAGLAGKPGSPYLGLEKTGVWQLHERESDLLWRNMQTRWLPEMTQFQKAELAPFAADHPVFYPFGGPDALTAHALFPQARYTVLAGLEPVGSVPDRSAFPDADLDRELAAYRKTLGSLLRRSFFITQQMKSQFGGRTIDGVLPVMLMQLVRSGCVLDGVQPLALSPDGSPVDAPPGAQPEGVAIAFHSAGSSATEFLAYWSVNLDDSHLEANKPFLNHIGNLAPFTTFLKSTSYLPHRRQFSLIRGLILKDSETVVQDDSGIPYHCFASAGFRVYLYGDYEKPYGQFGKLVQDDLRQAYHSANASKPLPFRMGYGFSRIPSNLQIARRGA